MNDLFPARFLQQIERLALRIRSAAPRVHHGGNRSTANGSSLEFRDYQSYTAGDDLRRVDWNVYQRTRHLFVRCHEHATPTPVHIVIDASESMLMETPGRYDTAARLAAAIASAALNSQNPVTVTELSGAGASQPRRITSQGQLVEVLGRLSERRGGGRPGIGMLQRILPALGAGGVMVVISDFFENDGVEALMGALGQVPFRLLLLQVSQQEDENPRLGEDFELIDCETSARVAVDAAPQVYQKYKTVYRDFFDTLRTFADQRGIRLVRFDAARSTGEQLDRIFERGVLTI